MSTWFEDNEQTAKIKATFDKETKTTYRFLIDENEFGVSGTLYVKKDQGKKPNSLQIRIKISGK